MRRRGARPVPRAPAFRAVGDTGERRSRSRSWAEQPNDGLDVCVDTDPRQKAERANVRLAPGVVDLGGAHDEVVSSGLGTDLARLALIDGDGNPTHLEPFLE